jgi:hypothetical protein
MRPTIESLSHETSSGTSRTLATCVLIGGVVLLLHATSKILKVLRILAFI